MGRKPSTLSDHSYDGHVSVTSGGESDFVGRVKEEWGDEESELRQAIFF